MKTSVEKPNSSIAIVPEVIENRIFLIRGQKVMIDRDLAELYQVTVRRLNERVKRNPLRFPQDFVFRLNEQEMTQLVADCDRFATLKHSSVTSNAFTEQGIAMLSSVLTSDRAIRVNVQIMRTFTKLRTMLMNHSDLKKKIEEMEKNYDHKFRIVFDSIRKLIEENQKPALPEKPKGQWGFVKHDK